jgi:hypothetical protein
MSITPQNIHFATLCMLSNKSTQIIDFPTKLVYNKLVKIRFGQVPKMRKKFAATPQISLVFYFFSKTERTPKISEIRL